MVVLNIIAIFIAKIIIFKLFITILAVTGILIAIKAIQKDK